MLWLPAVHDGKALSGVAPPFVLHRDGRVEPLPGTAPAVGLVIGATCPEQTSPDTKEVTPTSRLKAGSVYLLRRWEGSAWKDLAQREAGAELLRFDALAPDALYWLVEKDGKELERPFTIEEGRPRFL
jgi:hypothetical protein